MEVQNNSANEIKPQPKKSWLRKWLWRIGLLAVIVIAIYFTIGYFFTYSQGYRAGKLIKFSQKGFVFKTWEGQIYQGTITPDDQAGIASKYWDFSVDRDRTDIIKKLEDAMLTKHEVRLHYREKINRFNWRGETTYFVDSVSEVK